jgi:hypothetical protein
MPEDPYSQFSTTRKEQDEMSERRYELVLEVPLDAFHNHLQAASDLVIRVYEQLMSEPITPSKDRLEIASLFGKPLPVEPQPMDSVLPKTRLRYGVQR